MVSNISKMVYIFLYVAPFVFIRFYPFRNKLKKTVKTLCILYTAIIFIQSALFCFLSSQSFWNIELTQVFRMGFVVFYAILSFILINENIFKQIYIWCLMIAFASLIFANANFIESTFFFRFAMEYPHVIVNSVVILQISLIFPPLCKLLDKNIIPLIYSIDSNVWSKIWLVPALLFLGVYIATGSLSLQNVSTLSYLLIRYFSFFSMIFLSAVLFQALKQTSANARLSENVIMTDRQLILEREHYQFLTDHIEETKRIKHDLRHHMSLMQAYLNDNNIETLQEYLKQYNSTLTSSSPISFCNNYTIDVIVRHYFELAQQMDIDIDISIKLPEKMNFSDSDLCIVFGNLVENAVEACKRQENSNKFIIISAGLAGNNIIITVDNSFEGDIIKEDHIFLSSKREGKGIGVTSIQAIAEKYTGIAKFEFDKNIFRASVMLQNKFLN